MEDIRIIIREDNGTCRTIAGDLNGIIKRLEEIREKKENGLRLQKQG
jgi:hypothetical protein